MKISVIMPTLNSSKRLLYAINSLNEQTVEGFELVVIDSGSTDDTIKVINSHSVDTFPTRVISTPSCTPAQARNIGISHAAGGYIAFCDSDDIMKQDMLKTLYETADAKKADITVCDFDMVYPEQSTECFSQLSDGLIKISSDDITDYYYRFCAAPKPNNYVWSRLYRRKFLTDNSIRFPDVRYSEDHLMNLTTLFHFPRIAHIGKSLYCYIQHDSSAMREHIKRTNHGTLFLTGFQKAMETLIGKPKEVCEPILAIYAYTRIKSILFYAWQAQLSDADTANAVALFTSDDNVRRHLEMCLEHGYIGHYCALHSISGANENTINEMLKACIDSTDLPDMSEVFA